MQRRICRLTVVGLVALVAIAFMSTPAWAGKKDDTLYISLEKEMENVDRYFNTAREGIVFARHVYDNLLWRDPETYEYKGLLAKTFDWEGNTALVINLRQGVKFHNGQEMTADDVVYTLNWVIDPANGVLARNYVDWMKNVEKLGPYKVRINLHKPFPAAFEFLSGANPIYPKDYYAEVGPKGFGLKPIGTGPYKCVELEPGKRYVFVKNEDYFKDSPKGTPSIGKIVWRTIPEVNTKVAELMTGGLDWIWLVPKDQAKNLERVPNVRVVAAETMRIGFLKMDAANRSEEALGADNPFKHLKVRQAINHAIDREAISKNLVGGQSRVVNAACFPTQFGCTDDVVKYEYNPEKAKKLLAEAGYPNGFETTLYGYRNRPYAEAMVGYLRDAGIKAKLVMMKYSALRERSRAGKVQLNFQTWGSYSINDVSAIVSYFYKFQPDDDARDPQVRDWLDEGDSTIDVEARKAVYKKALQRIAEQAYWAPMFTWVSNNCMNKDLDFTPYPDAVPRFYRAKWK